MSIKDYVKSADWKLEKHVPVIELHGENIKANEEFFVCVSIGKDDPHPNEFTHYIKSLTLYFIPEGGSLAVELGTAGFSSHGELGSFSEPSVGFSVKLPKAGKLIATSYCNIHGLWESELDVKF